MQGLLNRAKTLALLVSLGFALLFDEFKRKKTPPNAATVDSVRQIF